MSLKLEKEDNENYHIKTPRGHILVIPKSELSDAAHHIVQRMSGGGTVPSSSVAPDYDKMVATPKALPGMPAGSSSEDYSDPNADQQYGPDASLNTPAASAQQFGPSSDLNDPGALAQDYANSPNQAPSAPTISAQGNQAMQQTSGNAQADNPILEDQKSLNQLYNTEVDQAQKSIQSTGEAGAAEANAYGDLSNKIGAMQSPNDIAAAHDKIDDAVTQHYANQPSINQNRLFQNMGTGNKILGGISLILGGIGASASGGQNLALNIMQEAINRDIDAQKNDQSKDMNLWKMNQASLGNDQMANLATQNQMLSYTNAKVMQATSKAKTADAVFRGQQLQNQIKQQQISNNQTMGLMSSNDSQQGGQSGGLFNADPSYLAGEIQDPAERTAVMGEIAKRQNMNKNGAEMVNAFQQAVKDTSGFVGAPTSMVYTPGSVMKLNSLIASNYNGVPDEKARIALIEDARKNLVPSGLDNKERIAQKTAAFQHWMNTESATPHSTGQRIPLDRFASTALPNMPQINPREGQTGTLPNGQKVVMKNGNIVPLRVSKNNG